MSHFQHILKVQYQHSSSSLSSRGSPFNKLLKGMFDVISSCEYDKHGCISVLGKSSSLQTKKGIHTARDTQVSYF